MSHNVDWDVNKYKEEHESEDHWLLRKAFLLKWKDHYPEERLVCLARVFTNVEFMGCRYPSEVMQEVARMSADVAEQYRSERKKKLQRTFVSASDAAGDKVKGVKRQGGTIVASPNKKLGSVAFVPQVENNSVANDKDINKHIDSLVPTVNESQSQIVNRKRLTEPDVHTNSDKKSTSDIKAITQFPILYGINYMQDMLKVSCLDPRDFNECMFNTMFGHFVLVIRPWTDMINNLRSTCANLKIPLCEEFKKGVYRVTMNNHVLADVTGGDKMSAKSRASRIIWDKLRYSTVVLLLKEQWISQNNEPISMTDMASKKLEFGEPIEESVALKMMKLMGWKGGGLGVDSQGIEEPIKPNFRVVRRAGLGHEASGGLQEFKRSGLALMRRRGIALDADLVFAADFTQDERAVLHQCANQCKLMSKSYGKGEDRFLVVSNKFRPVPVVRAVVKCGGETAKYRVFIPTSIQMQETIKNNR